MSNKKQHIPSGYKSSPLGIIPEDWEVKYLGDLLTRLTNGITYDVSVTVGKPVSRIETISNGEINYLKVGYIEDARGLETYKMQIGDILYSHINSLAHIGKVAYYDGKQELYHGMNLLLLRANNWIDSKFLYICLLTSQAKHTAQTMAKPAVNQASISTEDIKKIRIAIPTLPEQQRIVSVLSLWDTVIAKQTALIEQLTLRKRGLMQQLLTGKKRLKGFEGEWKEVRLGDTGSAYGGLVNKNKEDFENGNALFITYMNVFSNGKIDIDDLGQVRILPSEKQEQVQYGDIFFTVSSETPDEVGMASVLLNQVENTYLNSFCFGYRLNDFKTIVPLYASYLFRGDDFRKEMYKIAQGSTRFNISKTEVLNMRIIIPSIEEQNAIASVLVNADKEIEIAKGKLLHLQNQKRGLMQVLLTGKKRIKY